MDTPQQPHVTHHNKPWLVWTLLALTLVLIGIGAMLWWKLHQARQHEQTLQKENAALQQRIKGGSTTSAAPTPTPSSPGPSAPVCTGAVPQSTKDAITTALAAKSYAPLQPLMTANVNVVVAASEKGGEVTAAQAVTDLSYLNAATLPWNFSLPAADIAAYKAGFYSSYFADGRMIGAAANSIAATFGFDSCGKINAIFMAASTDLLK